MEYHIYILYSKKLNHFYVGQSFDLSKRFAQHNNGESSYTSQGIPWTLLWSTTKSTRREAELLEHKLKNLSKNRKIKFMAKYIEDVKDYEALRTFTDGFINTL